jgi:hypothetical protein
MLRRIRYQLERCPELTMSCTIKLSSRNIRPTRLGSGSLEQVKEVSDCVTQIVTAASARTRNPNDRAKCVKFRSA